MAIKFDFRKIPIHWRILIGGQFCVGALILAFRSRSIDATQQRDLARLEQAKPRGASALARAAKEEEQRARE